VVNCCPNEIGEFMPTFLKPCLAISMSLAILLSSCATVRQPVIFDTHNHIAYLSQPDGTPEKYLSVIDLSSLNSASLDTGLTHDGCHLIIQWRTNHVYIW
jgi:hypothetical protein